MVEDIPELGVVDAKAHEALPVLWFTGMYK
jgi:hypothetical protein